PGVVDGVGANSAAPWLLALPVAAKAVVAPTEKISSEKLARTKARGARRAGETVTRRLILYFVTDV
ncbi:MAG: hypothetical protein WAO61_00985, partial [Solirubrobacterales bacterium]